METSSNSTLYNLTEEERVSYLRDLDSKKWLYIYPVIIYLIILMVIGIIGNSIVIAVYYKKFKPSVPRLLILNLATFDLLTCSLSIPGVIVELRYYYTFFLPALCKIFRASRMYFVALSLFTLIILAVDRYRKVCRLFKPQYTIRSAWISVLASNVIAVCLSVLAAVVGGIRTVETDRDGVTGSTCSYDDDFIGTLITKIYGGVFFFTFISCITLLVVLYSLIGRQVWKHRRFRFNQDQLALSSFTCSQCPTASSKLRHYSNTSHNKYKIEEAEMSSGYSTGTDNINVISSSFMENTVHSVQSTQMTSQRQRKRVPASNESLKQNQQCLGGGQKRSTNKTTFTLFIITVIFTVSFLPFIVLVALWGSNWKFVNSLDGYKFTVYKIFFHSYHVNNVVNCYIYGFCNPKFRNDCKQLFCMRKAHSSS